MKIWDRSAETVVLHEIDGAGSVKRFRSRLNSHAIHARKKNFNWISIAATILVISGIGLWMYSNKYSVTYSIRETTSKIDSVLLNDGTKVILAANSSIKFPDRFTGDTREIAMLKGQAFFEVHKDPKHPFHIEIGHSKVSVLGTSFNIKFSSRNIDLSVSTGRVMFSPNSVSAPSILTTGQAISYNFKMNTLGVLNGTNANSWITKELHFVDMPLNEVCEQIGEHYEVKIELRDKAHTAKKFNANFKNSSLQEVLTVLQETYKIQISKSPNLIVIKTI